MKNLPPELIYLLVIGAVLLFNYVMQQVARQRQRELPQDEPPQEKPLPELWGRTPRPAVADLQFGVPPVPSRMAETPPVAAEVPRRLSPAKSLLRGRQNLRRAIVAMTILGPCRAQESSDGVTVGHSPGRGAP